MFVSNAPSLFQKSDESSNHHHDKKYSNDHSINEKKWFNARSKWEYKNSEHLLAQLKPVIAKSDVTIGQGTKIRNKLKFIVFECIRD